MKKRHKQKISEAMKGHIVLSETKRKISEAMSGKNHPNWKGGIWSNIKDYHKKYRERNRDYIRNYYNKYDKRMREISPEYRINHNMARMLRYSIKERNGLSWEKLVGYTLKDLIKRLEFQFDNNMSWKNYGNYWHIDHKKPKSLFNYTNPKEQSFKDCWCLANLQPLEAIENIRKGNKFKVS